MCNGGGARGGSVAARSVHSICGASSPGRADCANQPAGALLESTGAMPCSPATPDPKGEDGKRQKAGTRWLHISLSSCVCARTHCSSSLLRVFFFFFFFLCQTFRQSSPLCDCWNKTEAGVKPPRSRSRPDRKILSGIRFYTGTHKAECSKKGNLKKKKKIHVFKDLLTYHPR